MANGRWQMWFVGRDGCDRVDRVEDESAEPSAESERERGRGWGGRWIVFGLCLLAYLLGIGPAYRLAERRLISQNAVEAVYSPVIILSLHCPPAMRLYRWYVFEVWQVR